MEDTKVLKTTGPLRVDPVTGAMLTKLGPWSAAAYIAGLRLATTGGTVAFTGLPANANTITVGDETYTFLDTLLGADNEVHIEMTRDATMANLVTAININAPDTAPVYPEQGITATLVVVAGADNDTLTLEPSVRGASGNTVLSRVGANITVVSLSGGADYNNTAQLAIQSALEDIKAAVELSAGSNVTFTPVKIDQNVGGAGVSVLIADLGSNYTRCHGLFGSSDLQGTVTLQDSAAATLTGPMAVGTLGGWVIPFCAHPHGCPKTAVGKGMNINTTQEFNGFAIVSQSVIA